MEQEHNHYEKHDHHAALPAEKTVADHIRQWLTPMLILVIGWLIGDKLAEVSKKLEVITILQVAQAQMRVEIDGLKKDINRTDTDFRDHKKESDAIHDSYKTRGVFEAAERNLRRTK